MPKRGYKQSESHKNKIGEKTRLRGNGWLGRKHSESSIKKMRKSKSQEHRLHMSEAALRRWRKGKVGWLVEPKKPLEPIPPQQYKDIFMDYDSSWEGIIDKL